jgi:hypothetical protein
MIDRRQTAFVMEIAHEEWSVVSCQWSVLDVHA